MRQSERASGSGSIAVAGAQVSSTPSVSRPVFLYHTSRCRTMRKWPTPTTATGPTCNEGASGGDAQSASVHIWHCCNCQAVFPVSQRRRQKNRGHDRLAPRYQSPCCSWAYLLHLINRPEPCTDPPAMSPFIFTPSKIKMSPFIFTPSRTFFSVAQWGSTATQLQLFCL